MTTTEQRSTAAPGAPAAVVASDTAATATATATTAGSGASPDVNCPSANTADPDVDALVASAVDVDLVTISGALSRLRQTEWWRLSEQSVLDAATGLEAVLRSGFGVQVRLAGEIAERSMHNSFGERSAGHLLAHTLRIPVGQAKARISAAAAAYGTETLAGEALPPFIPGLAAAIDAGEISDEHARVITTCIAKTPAAVGDDTRALCHQVLLTEATQRDPIGLRTVAEQIEAICDPDGTLSGKDPTDRMELSMGHARSDGLTPLRGLLDALTAEQLRVALEGLAAPKPIDDHTPDRRPAALRNAQAFSEIITRYLAAQGAMPDGLPDSRHGGARPTVAVTINTADLAARTDPNHTHDTGGGDGGDGGGGGGFAVGPDRTRGGGGGSAVGHDRTRDGGDGGYGPIGSAAAAGRFDYGGAASLATTRMLACDGELIRQVLGADGAILDQGRAVRLFTRAQRRALITRDKGCAFPGCDIPAGWSEAHHLHYWSHGGASDLADGVLLCRRHHTVIHQEHWQIQPPETPRARPWFIPPAHIDPARKPRRNTHFHLPQALIAIKTAVRAAIPAVTRATVKTTVRRT